MSEIRLSSFTKISDYEWEIPTTFRSDMRVPVRVFASRSLLEESLKDKSIEQAVNASTLPGLVEAVMVMPDMHQGYGFPIGGVAATDPETGVISPGGIGYDINCGVRLLTSKISFEEIEAWLPDLATALNQYCPSGVGVDSDRKLSMDDLADACIKGSRWAKGDPYTLPGDIERTEDEGSLPGADPDKVSQRAMERGRKQLGTLGGGNHFIEVDLITDLFDEKAARVMGLSRGDLAIQIHTGSRGFGHQICTDYVRRLAGGC
jgi:tRNA-splicing ligase RtcB (3'-phosphate/5'-hydroxy nucleic acid ligase)